MFQWGIRVRLIVSFLFLIILTISLLGSYILWYFYQHNLDSLAASLLTNAQITEQLLVDKMLDPKERDHFDSNVKELGTITDLRLSIIDITGTVVADSWENPLIMDNHRQRPEIASSLNGERGMVIRYSDTIHQNMLYVSIPMRKDREIIGVVRVASTLAHIETGFDKIKSAIFTAMFLTSLLAIAIAIRLARKYTKPLEEITATARQLAEGNLGKRVHVHTGDELELLAHTMNTLASNLDDKIKETLAETHKLSLILRHMHNAVILHDKYGRVTTVNKMARDIFGITDDMLGQHNIQVIGNSLLDRAVHDTIAERASNLIDLKTNIQNHKRVFQVFLAPMISTENELTGVLSVFHDITTLQEVHERQAEFVSNASHELATPLTSIKGFAETLLDGALDDRELSIKFINIIDNEAERMQRLIKELLQLAKLDSEEYRKQVLLESTPIKPLFKAIAQELAPHADRKNIQILIESTPVELFALANPDWLKQAIVNLLDNSIKYTPAGGKVFLKCWLKDSEVVVMVKDSGIGISAQDLPLIFDRFYRVNRARTAGGTGLGLPIVKFIVEMHGGKITVKSDINLGTTFTFTLPLASVQTVDS